ncbi:hypothetical protein B0T24DRAFT_612682 [Lasiosphaeria ovina]|uniref:Glucose-methanol-choline oxidoreductase N-terminal domain-containing protein n=1 Tax=Lasiosphaeria ovina TaxID=92902 RepID=A0AAE0TSJ4_9PEZI|nr:hypothetical protein B0T24DRAFT_612682 [Lasiosphaeria ovina]
MAPVYDNKAQAAYDYIVVGGGTAGAAVATRLSQTLPDKAILLIEAGASALDDPNVNIPGLFGRAFATSLDWNFASVPQAGLNNRVTQVNRGKMLGGSSGLNIMVWDRASAPEYDAWEKLGNPGWNWESMVAAMTKVEAFTPSPDYGGTAGVGTAGPVKTIINPYVPEHAKLWIPTLNSLGVPLNLESLGGNPLGAMFQPNTIDPKTYTRTYAANGYLPAAGPNLQIMTDTRVAKINLDASPASPNRTATGVTLQDGTVIHARNEVILSAGSIQSPGLLELSGIGQKAVLDAAGIAQVVDLPGVGENLQDHVRVQATYQLKDGYTSNDRLRFDQAAAGEQMALFRAGQLSMFDYSLSSFAFTNWEQTVGETAAAALTALATQPAAPSLASDPSAATVTAAKLAFLANAAVPQVELIYANANVGIKRYPLPDNPLYGQQFVTIMGGLMQPLSRGRVHVTSTNIDSPPAIDPNHLGSAYDVAATVAIMHFVRHVANTPPLRDLWAAEYEPALDAGASEDEWRSYVRDTAGSIFHPVGTCAMLPRALGGVVSPELTVYGTANLRVVDASVMPVLLSAHPQTAVYGIAERAAEFIVRDCKAGGR